MLKTPHYLAIAAGLAVIVITWLTAQNAAGALVLPAYVTMACGILLPILTMLSPSTVASTNVKAALSTGDVQPVSLMARTIQGDAVAKAASKIAPLACLLLLVGCAQGIAAIGPGIVFAGCVWTTYQKEAPGVPIGQVIADEVAACGGDAASVVVVLDSREPTTSHTGVAHADMVKR
jgi:hypothetical protein